MQNLADSPAASDRGKWLTLAILLAVIVGGLVLAYVARDIIGGVIFKPPVPGAH